jgi:hypothetical protein
MASHVGNRAMRPGKARATPAAVVRWSSTSATASSYVDLESSRQGKDRPCCTNQQSSLSRSQKTRWSISWGNWSRSTVCVSSISILATGITHSFSREPHPSLRGIQCEESFTLWVIHHQRALVALARAAKVALGFHHPSKESFGDLLLNARSLVLPPSALFFPLCPLLRHRRGVHCIPGYRAPDVTKGMSLHQYR